MYWHMMCAACHTQKNQNNISEAGCSEGMNTRENPERHLSPCLCFSSSMYRFIPRLVVLVTQDSNVAVYEQVCWLFCVLYMPLFGFGQVVSKMGLTSLHDFYDSWHLYIWRSLFDHSTFLALYSPLRRALQVVSQGGILSRVQALDRAMANF